MIEAICLFGAPLVIVGLIILFGAYCADRFHDEVIANPREGS